MIICIVRAKCYTNDYSSKLASSYFLCNHTDIVRTIWFLLLFSLFRKYF